MSTVVHGPAATWAAAHRALLFLLALSVAVVAAVTVVLVVQAADDPAPATTGSVAPVEEVDPACADLPMTGTFC
ncbi:hypothetical protein [Blastococcus sp. SYSU D01042]